MTTVSAMWDEFVNETGLGEHTHYELEGTRTLFYAGAFAVLWNQVDMANRGLDGYAAANEIKSWYTECVEFAGSLEMSVDDGAEVNE